MLHGVRKNKSGDLVYDDIVFDKSTPALHSQSIAQPDLNPTNLQATSKTEIVKLWDASQTKAATPPKYEGPKEMLIWDVKARPK